MHIRSLKIFCDVVAQRSFSRAADDNGISQSGASQVVHQLEQQLGVKLIDRSKRPFVLTSEGTLYYEGSRRLVQEYFALEEEVRTLSQEMGGRVSIASIYSIGLSHMSQYIQGFLAAFPQADVRLQYQHPLKVYEFVENDQVDIGLVSYPQSNRNVDVIQWREEPMVFVCSVDHPLASQETITVEDLKELPIVGFDETLTIRRKIDELFLERGIEPRLAMAFDNIETIKRAVEINLGVTLLPKPTVEREITAGTLSAATISDARLVRPLGIIHRHGKIFGKTARRFVERLREEAVGSFGTK